VGVAEKVSVVRRQRSKS